MTNLVKAENLVKTYVLGEVEVRALRGLSFAMTKGEFVSVTGPSGCGKSTLMHIIGCLDRPNAGSLSIDGTDVATLTDNQLAELRNKKIGFVFQSYNLLPRMTAVENVELPLIYSNIEAKQRRDRAIAVLDKVGLGKRALHRPPELSGGEKQRVAIARALIVNPTIVLADEPTGNLDSKATAEIIAIFQKLNAEGVTILMVTHEVDVANHTKRNIHVVDGQVVKDELVQQVII